MEGHGLKRRGKGRGGKGDNSGEVKEGSGRASSRVEK